MVRYGWGKVHVAGSCKHDNEPSGFIKCWGFLDYVRKYKLLKNKSSRWLLVKYFVSYLVSYEFNMQ